MATINKEIAQQVMDRNGRYHPDDPLVDKIVTYNNQFDGDLAYAAIFEGQNFMRYEQSPACQNVKTLWTRQ